MTSHEVGKKIYVPPLLGMALLVTVLTQVRPVAESPPWYYTLRITL